ncbi:MAG: flagellar biosynthetic protein FliO [Verrucomicrobiota bacterium]
MEYSVEWWRWVLLIVLFAGLFGAWWWVNRGKINFQKLMTPPEPQIKIIERQWVSHGVAIFLVEVKGERFLLARTQGNVSWQKLESQSKST